MIPTDSLVAQVPPPAGPERSARAEPDPVRAGDTFENVLFSMENASDEAMGRKSTDMATETSGENSIESSIGIGEGEAVDVSEGKRQTVADLPETTRQERRSLVSKSEVHEAPVQVAADISSAGSKEVTSEPSRQSKRHEVMPRAPQNTEIVQAAGGVPKPISGAETPTPNEAAPPVASIKAETPVAKATTTPVTAIKADTPLTGLGGQVTTQELIAQNSRAEFTPIKTEGKVANISIPDQSGSPRSAAEKPLRTATTPENSLSKQGAEPADSRAVSGDSLGSITQSSAPPKVAETAKVNAAAPQKAETAIEQAVVSPLEEGVPASSPQNERPTSPVEVRVDRPVGPEPDVKMRPNASNIGQAGFAPLSAFLAQAKTALDDGSLDLKAVEFAPLQASSSSVMSPVNSPPVAPNPVPQQVAQQVANAIATAPGNSTQITLNPEELGRVRISISSGEAGLVVNILAERPETADLMRRNIDVLLKEFADLGYDQPSFEFDQGHTDHPDSHEAGSPILSQTTDLDGVAAVPTPRSAAANGSLNLIL